MKPRTLAICLFGTMAFLAGPAAAEVLTLPSDQWPAWVHRDGIVMAGSWEPLPFRIRRTDANRRMPTPSEQATWDREHSPEMVERLKALGANFVMMHCYKGAGLITEQQSMADAVRFAGYCHEAGLKVGVYNYSGAFLWAPFFGEVPEAQDWVLLDEDGKPEMYGRQRYFWNRNHPDAVKFYRPLVHFAIDQIKTDLIHFDNYHASAGFDPQSVRDFRLYLSKTFSPDELKQAGIDVDTAIPPRQKEPPSLLKFAWLDFQCGYLAKSYWDMSRYARTLRKDILMECNPMSVPRYTVPPVDHGRILPAGEASWDESLASGWKDGKLATRIRTFKINRLMDNMAFSYITSPIEAAETMAFNHPDCFGCICWFEYADIVAKPGSEVAPDPQLQPFIRFFHDRRELLRGANVVADVAILRSFPSQVFADPKFREITASVEDDLIAQRIPFQIIYDRQLPDLKRWPVLVLAGCAAMSDAQIAAVTDFVRGGGKLCVVGQVAMHDEWMRPRTRPALADLPTDAVARVEMPNEAVPGIGKLRGDALSLRVDCTGPVCAELTSQPGRRLVHLVNYDPRKPVENIRVTICIPSDQRAKSVLVADPLRDKDATIPFEQEGRRVRFVVPKLSIYALAAIQTQ